MKNHDQMTNSNGTEHGNQTGNMPFLRDITPELFEAVYCGLDAEQKPMAFISADLFVLRQTRACENLLERGTFYSVESVLPPMLCAQLRQCIRTGEQAHLSAQLMQQRWTIRVVPARDGALLVFEPEEQRQAGVTMAAARLRVSASHLLAHARALDGDGRTEEAAELRYEALRILRQIGHMEVLFGAPEPMLCRRLELGEVLETLRRQLAARGVTVQTQTDAPKAHVIADEQMLLSALAALVSNSLGYGGEQVHIRLTAAASENGVVFGVDDDGAGLSEQALSRMNDSWTRTDALPGGWGLGIPFVRGIAARHGGMLIYPSAERGCSARLYLPDRSDDWELFEMDTCYDASMKETNPTDVELSGVLAPEAYGAR